MKRGERYIFRYRPGEESTLLASLIELARDPSSDLDTHVDGPVDTWAPVVRALDDVIDALAASGHLDLRSPDAAGGPGAAISALSGAGAADGADDEPEQETAGRTATGHGGVSSGARDDETDANLAAAGRTGP